MVKQYNTGMPLNKTNKADSELLVTLNCSCKSFAWVFSAFTMWLIITRVHSRSVYAVELFFPL